MNAAERKRRADQLATAIETAFGDDETAAGWAVEIRAIGGCGVTSPALTDAERHAEVLAKALDQFFSDSAGHEAVALRTAYVRLAQRVKPTLRALGYPKETPS
jgi:pyruvoyl-dependent arginine decarboxylase (PvlArgDC)